MRALTAQAEAARQRRSVRLTRLLTVTLQNPTLGDLVLQLSDRALRLTKASVPLSDEWWPYVLSWGRTGDALGLLDAGVASKGSLDVTLNNAKPILGTLRFSDLLRGGLNTGGYDLSFALVTLKVLLEDGAVEDAVTVFDGRVDDVVGVTSTSLTLRCTDRLLEVPDETVILGACAGSLPVPAEPITGIWIENGIGNEIHLQYTNGPIANVPAGPPFLCSQTWTGFTNNGTCGTVITNAFDREWSADFPGQGLNFNSSPGMFIELLRDYTAHTSGTLLNVFENTFCGFYRSLEDAPGSTLRFSVNTSSSYGWRGNPASGGVKVWALVYVLAFAEPTTLGQLHSLSHDDLRGGQPIILGSFLTSEAGPHEFPIGSYRLIGFRFAEEMPVPPAINQKNFDEVDIEFLSIS